MSELQAISLKCVTYNVGLSSVYKMFLPVVNTVIEADTFLAVFGLESHMVLLGPSLLLRGPSGFEHRESFTSQTVLYPAQKKEMSHRMI